MRFRRRLRTIRLGRFLPAWFSHPWRPWNRPKRVKRHRHLVYFGGDATHALGTSDGRHLVWLMNHFPHTFAFPERNLPFQEVREWMDQNAVDLWTMGYFHPGFRDERVFIRDDDTALAFRMRFTSVYQRSVDADEVTRTINMCTGIIAHTVRTNGFKIRI